MKAVLAFFVLIFSASFVAAPAGANTASDGVFKPWVKVTIPSPWRSDDSPHAVSAAGKQSGPTEAAASKDVVPLPRPRPAHLPRGQPKK